MGLRHLLVETSYVLDRESRSEEGGRGVLAFLCVIKHINAEKRQITTLAYYKAS